MKRNSFAMRTLVRMLAVLTALVAGLSPQLEAQPEGQHSAPASRVVMYLVGRGFLNPNNGQSEIVGYITDIKGILGPLFSGLPSESTAFFTFRSDIFTLQPLPTNGDVGLSLVTPGTFSLYLNVSPDGAASAQVVLTDDAFTWSQTPKIKYGDSVALEVSQNANSYLKFSSGEWL